MTLGVANCATCTTTKLSKNNRSDRSDEHHSEPNLRESDSIRFWNPALVLLAGGYPLTSVPSNLVGFVQLVKGAGRFFSSP